MTDTDRTFGIASEDNLIDLIKRARRRLVFICPALTEPVAKALADRLEEGFEGMTAILDGDPEVYRLGYGTEAGLERLRDAAGRSLFDLRIQQGIRIGVVISDDVTMVFSPVPLLIEAGSTSNEKPNAILFSGDSVGHLVRAAGAGPAESADRQEIGTKALTPALATALQADLKINPPQPFDVARALRVFSSRVQYVEIQVENYRFSNRQVQLPPELLGITDDQLRDQISSRLRAPAEALGPFEITVETADGETKIKAGEKWISHERKRIEDQYTYIVPRYGRVIFSRDRDAFNTTIERFKRNLKTFCDAGAKAFREIASNFENRLVSEYLPRWKQNPPGMFERFGIPVTDESIERELRNIVKMTTNEAIAFEPPQVRVVYKNIAQESIYDADFHGSLRKVMIRRRVPISLIDSLFAVGDAAPAKGRFSDLRP
jgi:hypothetical protein